MLSPGLCPFCTLNRFTHVETPWTLMFRSFYGGVSLRWHDWLNSIANGQWFNLYSLTPPGQLGLRMKVPTLESWLSLSGRQLWDWSYLGVPIISVATKDTHHSGALMSFMSSVPESGDKDKIFTFYYTTIGQKIQFFIGWPGKFFLFQDYVSVDTGIKWRSKICENLHEMSLNTWDKGSIDMSRGKTKWREEWEELSS